MERAALETNAEIWESKKPKRKRKRKRKKKRSLCQFSDKRKREKEALVWNGLNVCVPPKLIRANPKSSEMVLGGGPSGGNSVVLVELPLMGSVAS